MKQYLVSGDQKKLEQYMKVFLSGEIIPQHKPLVLDLKIKKVKYNK